VSFRSAAIGAQALASGVSNSTELERHYTSVSGSGKSSLAFGTLYAEAQRRYLESEAPYACTNLFSSCFLL
jgi:hypothetical protein